MYRHKAAMPANKAKPITAFALDLRVRQNLAGAMGPLRNITQNTKVQTIDTAVLMARICPNLANSCIVVKQRGMDAATVVIAELSIDEPMWDIAADVLQPRISCK